MTPKTVVITGATSGIGKATAKTLALAGHHVVILARSAERVAKAVAEIEAALQATGDAGLAAVRTIECDLASTTSVRRAAAELHETCPRIDALINNAGVLLYRRHESVDGHELTFAVNHLGHFLLTTLLMDRLRESAPARIVVLGSVAHKVGKIWFDNLQLKGNYGIFRAYGQSKLANIMFTRELARRLDGTGVTVNAVDPGTVATTIAARSRDGVSPVRALFQALLWPILRPPDQGATTVVHLATSPDVEGVSGRYFKDRREIEPSPAALDEEAGALLWEISEQLVKNPACNGHT
ncbi:MAG: SDR family oxidoreductase, partial [Spirochaetaceae bacterium]|nr:SDR family oxidoreductase [Spirochaetaceae bacterium]